MTRPAMESSRMRADAMLTAGDGPSKIARKLGVSRVSVYRWKALRLSRHGLKIRPTPGRPRWVSMERLRDLWLEQAKWKGHEFAAAIRERLGVEYDPDHCYRIMKKLRGAA